MHTQGPWEIAAENCGGGLNILAANGARILHSAEVAKYADGGPVTRDEAMANATVAAAAPDLLTAAKIALSCLRVGGGFPDAVAELELAISKATLVR